MKLIKKYLNWRKQKKFWKLQKLILPLINNPIARKYLGVPYNKEIVQVTASSISYRKDRNHITAKIYSGPKIKSKGKRIVTTGTHIAILLLALKIPETLVLPLISLTTESYFAGNGDGRVQFITNQPHTWDEAHDDDGSSAAVAATDDEANGAGPGTRWYFPYGTYGIYRIFFPFDTSALPDDCNITEATLNIRVYGKNNDDNDGDDWINVVKTFQALTSELIKADYEDCGYDAGNEQGGRAKYTPVEGAARIDIGDILTSGFTVWTLNAIGRGWINKTGWTKLGLREGHDCLDHPILGGGETDYFNNISVLWSERAGTDEDPYLEVTYALEYTLTAAVGTFVLTGIAAILIKGYTLVASVGEFVLTGIATTFTKTLKIVAAVVSFILSGIAARLGRAPLIELLIDSVNKTSDIVVDSLVKVDIINEQKDTLKFRVQKYGDVGFTPAIGQEIALNIDGVKEFGGVILEIKKSIQAGQMVVYDVICCDYSQHINRELVLERYDDKTVDYIIATIVAKYADTFTVANVNCPTEIKTMIFNRMTMTECLTKLAREVGYSWYIDHDKDIHFFAKTENIAPFEVTDSNGKYLQNTLIIRDDLSQIRNKVTIRGGQEKGIERTESYIADGDQTTFPLTNKFANVPEVFVEGEGATSTVGIDYLHAEEDYDCFWDFGQKYIRFKAGTKPAATKKVDITGIPLFSILVRESDYESIAQYGIYEFFREDKSIKSRTEAFMYAQAELEAYKDKIIEGEFKTDKAGLRSGQLITIDSDLMDIDETFLIQKVQFRIIAKDKRVWSVKLATMRTIGMIQILQDLIRLREIKEFDPDNLLTLVQLDSSCRITVVLGTPATTLTKSYVWVNGEGASQKIYWSLWSWAD